MAASYLKFISLTIRNFLSIGNQTQELPLDGGDSVLILGVNHDAPQGAGGNGCGKTTIINALCYALYNKPFDQISLQRLINRTNATKNTLMEVRLTFEKDGKTYEIYRARGEEYRIEFTRDGEDITPGKGVNETDALIQDVIGMSYDMFTKTVIFSGNAAAFLDLPIHQQRNQIEELFSISLLSEKAVLLKDKIRQVESDIKIAEALFQQQQGAVALHEQQLVDAENRITKWDRKRDADIKEITTTLAELESVDIDAEQELHARRSVLKTKLSTLNAQITSFQKDVNNQTRTVTKLMGEQEHLEDAKCPYCSQAFADAPAKLEHILDEIETVGAALLSAEESLNYATDEKKKIDEEIKELNSKITHADIDELINARSNKVFLEQKLIELREAVNPHTEVLEKLLEVGVQEADVSRVDVLRKTLDHQTFLLKLLTDKNSFIRRRIISKTIPILNDRLNHHTYLLGLPHEVKFDADMSCTVSEFGRELDFGNLSAGEKKRVNTSMSMAFRDVLHTLHTKINLLMVDELDGALDQQGIDSVIRVLKDKARDEEISTFVISHHPSVLGRLDRTLTVEKENGFSSISFN